MRWTAGPLDIARRQKEKEFTPEKAEVLRKWQDPSLLASLQGTPVNCLAVSWASGLPEDAAQQQALKPLIQSGRQAGLDVVGLIEGAADKPAALAAARSAGLSAVGMDAAPPGDAGIPMIAWAKSGPALWNANSKVLGMSDGLWPGVPQEKTPTGGPTNLPWVDSNGALLAMLKAFAPVKPVWVAVDPPPQAKLTVENYLLTVADAETYGGRWVISLDAEMRAGLAAKSAPTLEGWKKITAAMAFFQQDKPAGTFQRMGRLAVMSNFSAPDREFGEDVLNMLPRLREPFRVIARSQALAASFNDPEWILSAKGQPAPHDDLGGPPAADPGAILYVDQEPPDPALRQKLIAFVNEGGTLFVPSKWPNPEGSQVQLSPEESYLLYDVRSVGKGRLAVAREDKPDSYFTCMDVQNILSHRRDPARLYNGASMNYFFQATPQGKNGLIAVLNYSRRPGSDNALIYLKTPWQAARFVSPEIAAPVALQWARQTLNYEIGGVELSLPRISVYGAVQMTA